jgi:hypothetical protein
MKTAGNSLRALAARFYRHAQQSDRVRSLSIEILNLKAGAAAARIHQFFKVSKIRLAGRRSCRGPRAPSISESSTDRMCRAGCRRPPSYRSLIQPAKEQLRHSKLTTAGIGSDTDFSHATKFAEAMAHKRSSLFPPRIRAVHHAGPRRDPPRRWREHCRDQSWGLWLRSRDGEPDTPV